MISTRVYRPFDDAMWRPVARFQVWFKNRRAKLKREVKDGKSPTAPSSDSHSSKSPSPPYGVALYSSDVHSSPHTTPSFSALGIRTEHRPTPQPFFPHYGFPTSLPSELSSHSQLRPSLAASPYDTTSHGDDVHQSLQQSAGHKPETETSSEFHGSPHSTHTAGPADVEAPSSTARHPDTQ